MTEMMNVEALASAPTSPGLTAGHISRIKKEKDREKADQYRTELSSSPAPSLNSCFYNPKSEEKHAIAE